MIPPQPEPLPEVDPPQPEALRSAIVLMHPNDKESGAEEGKLTFE